MAIVYGQHGDIEGITCTDCKTLKPMEDYHKCRRNFTTGRQRRCRVCCNAKSKERYERVRTRGNRRITVELPIEWIENVQEEARLEGGIGKLVQVVFAEWYDSKRPSIAKPANLRFEPRTPSKSVARRLVLQQG